MSEYLGPAPSSIDAAIIQIIKVLQDHSSMWSEDEDTFVTHLHHNLGQDIRNFWGLWSQDSELYKVLAGMFMLSHADDLSSLLLIAAYRTYNELPLDLEEEAAKYHEHWIKILRNEPF